MILPKPDKHGSNERRNSYRYSVDGARRDARIRIGTREVAALILDESANGFSVLLDGTAGCCVGQKVLLHSASGWTEVRVMSLHLQKPFQPGQSEFQLADSQVRLGLMRVRDLEVWEVDPEEIEWFSWSTLRSLMTSLAPVGRSLKGAVGLIFGALLAAVIGVWALERFVASNRAGDEDAENATTAVGFHPARTLKQRSSPAPQPAGQPQQAGPKETPPQEASKRPEIEPLLSREELSQLTLEQSQLDELRQVIGEYGAMVDQAVFGDDASPAPRSIPNPDIELGRRGLAVLTEQQRGSLIRLLLQPAFLLKHDVAKLLALSGEQIQQLLDLFDESKATLDTTSVADELTTAPGAQDADAELGRRGLAILTEEQRGSLIRLLSVADPPEQVKTADEQPAP